MNTTRHPLVYLGLILGGSLIVSVIVVGAIMLRIRNASDVITVTGSAKIQVTSDQAKWTSQISRSARQSTLSLGYAQLAEDLAQTKAFLASQNISEAEYTVSPVSMNEIYQQNQSAEKLYSLSQMITVQSPDVAKLTTAANATQNIIAKGVIFSTFALEYYYSKLPDARIELLSQAIEDAKVRAGEIAKTSGRRAGNLKNAASGVVQVQSLNSTDVSDYGSYDTSQIEKQITVTVKATFSLR